LKELDEGTSRRERVMQEQWQLSLANGLLRIAGFDTARSTPASRAHVALRSLPGTRRNRHRLIKPVLVGSRHPNNAVESDKRQEDPVVPEGVLPVNESPVPPIAVVYANPAAGTEGLCGSWQRKDFGSKPGEGGFPSRAWNP